MYWYIYLFLFLVKKYLLEYGLWAIRLLCFKIFKSSSVNKLILPIISQFKNIFIGINLFNTFVSNVNSLLGPLSFNFNKNK